MSFEDLEEFIQVQNKKLKPSNRYLCATALNGYDVMIVGVEKSLGHKKPLVSAHAKFRIARTEADCVFPDSADIDIDWRYVGPIIGLVVLGFLIWHGCFELVECRPEFGKKNINLSRIRKVTLENLKM